MSGASEEEDLPIDEWPEWIFFKTVEDLVDKVMKRRNGQDGEPLTSLFPFLDSIRMSSKSFAMLVRADALRDSYVIGRMIYETAINAAFVATDPEALFARATRHANQKSLRDLVRTIEIAGTALFKFEHSAANQLMNEPAHKQWLDEFTSRSGREITSWTPENVQQRLEAVYARFGEDAVKGLAFGLLMYRHASEIAHGTLYGTLFSWGATEIGRSLRSPADLALFRRLELRHLLKLVCFSLESLVRVLAIATARQDLGAAAKDAFVMYYAARGRGV